MRVLNLVTNPDAEFYTQQTATLRRQGVAETTLPVPGERTATDEGTSSRSPLDYLRYYPSVLRHSFDGYDVIHANYGLTAPAALAQPNAPVVITLWGSDVHGAVGRVSRLCARVADAVIVMSEEMAAKLEVDCHVIPHGIDLRTFRPFSTRAAREAVGWRQDARHVLFPYPTGRPVKNFPRAQRVVERVRERWRGRGGGESTAEEIELQTISGVPHDRMPLYLNAADALLLTSKSEGSPNSVKEALACNLPVVATDVGDVSRRLDGVEPSTVATSDEELVEGLLAVLEHGGPSNGRETVQSLSLQRMGERIRRVYQSVV
jgi:glycosyltransferase involved in cell wall biosynthesis